MDYPVALLCRYGGFPERSEVLMDRQSLRMQWAQLLVLSSVHFLVDMFGNILPAILPAIRREFVMSLSVGGFILASLTLTSNGVQLVTGQMRPNKTRPLFLYLGMLAAACVCLIPAAPRSPVGVILLVGFGVLSGCGIAIAHPEGLRAVHTLDRISPSLSTAVFMTSGFFGFASGGAISAALVASYGLAGLYPLMFSSLLGILAVRAVRVRLAVAPGQTQGGGDPQGPSAATVLPVPFWKILVVGIPAAVSTTVVLLLIPTHLDVLGFDLRFGGFSTAMFGWGGAIGPFVWAAIAYRKGDLPSSFGAFMLSVPFAILYLVFVQQSAAVWFLFGTGFSAMSGYILTITLARDAEGLNLGHRMAFIVGGTWGIAMLIFLPLSALADRLGTGPILRLAPAGYLLSGLLAFWVLWQYPELARPRRVRPALEVGSEEHTPVA